MNKVLICNALKRSCRTEAKLWLMLPLMAGSVGGRMTLFLLSVHAGSGLEKKKPSGYHARAQLFLRF